MVEPETPKPARAKAEPVRDLTYEIGFDAGQTIRVVIPSSYKITFGPIAGVKGYEGGGMAFRAWENETRQRLLYRGVAYFRDLSIPSTVKCVRRFGSDVWFPDDGTWVGKKGELVQHAWKSTDDPDVVDDDPETKLQPVEENDGWTPKATIASGRTLRAR